MIVYLLYCFIYLFVCQFVDCCYCLLLLVAKVLILFDIMGNCLEIVQRYSYSNIAKTASKGHEYKTAPLV